MKKIILSFMLGMLFLVSLTACKNNSNSTTLDSRYYEDIYAYLDGINLIDDSPIVERIDYMNMNLSDYISSYNLYGIDVYEKDELYTALYVKNSIYDENYSLNNYLSTNNLSNYNVLIKEFINLEDINLSINNYELIAVLSSYKCKVYKCYTSNKDMDLVFPVFESNEFYIKDGKLSIVQNNETTIHKELRKIQKGYPMPIINESDNSWYGGSLSSLGNIEIINNVEYLVTNSSDEFLSGYSYEVNDNHKMLMIEDLFN